MTTVTYTFDSGTPGSNVVVNSSITEIIAGTPKYIAGFHGAAGIQAGSPSNTADTKFRLTQSNDIGQGDHYGSAYLRYNTDSGSGSASCIFLTVVSPTNEFIFQMRARPGGALSIRVAGSTEVRTGTPGEIPVGSWIRIDWHVVGNTIDWRLFWTPEGTTPDLSGTVTTTATGLSDSIILGAESSSAVIKDFSFDTIRFSNGTSWFGPYQTTPPPPAGPTVKLWTGSAEVAVSSVSIWTGSAEVAYSSVAIS